MDYENILTPEMRLKQISDVGNTVELNSSIPARRYFKSGLEMVRMANVYYDEGNLENAFGLYMKFMTLMITTKQERRAQEERLRLEREAAEAAARKAATTSQRLMTSEVKRSLPADGWSLAKSVTPVPPLPADLLLYPSDDVTPTPFPTPVSVPIPTSGAAKDSRPDIDRSKKPSLLSAVHTSRHALRTVVVPSTLMHKFLSIASSNTNNNIETCGILGGVLEYNKLVVTHLLVPLQTGKSDACITQKEEQIFDYQDQNELVTFGWIHTHPTQTAFLSSVDLHTHCSYQLLMPEAIAVVCAPKYKDNQCFCLTPSYGVDYIAGCRQSGFHPHPSEPPLYMVAEHVKFVEGAPLEVVDFRKR
ncbi:AMSH-like protease [Nilaparvata lugens]|uniref:AMSH-like protease n=1 Tax=Nilaparvata lugens TaxID=108931 RepID=UPI00193CCF40|nr:AMSH-like protease [Nilaparvata lugens]